LQRFFFKRAPAFCNGVDLLHPSVRVRSRAGILRSCIGAVYQPDHGGDRRNSGTYGALMNSSGRLVSGCVTSFASLTTAYRSQLHGQSFEIEGINLMLKRPGHSGSGLLLRRCNIPGRQGSLPASGTGNVTNSNPLHTVYPFLNNRFITGITTTKKGNYGPAFISLSISAGSRNLISLQSKASSSNSPPYHSTISSCSS